MTITWRLLPDIWARPSSRVGTIHASIFTIEKHAVVGGIIQDITRPVVQKEQVINEAHQDPNVPVELDLRHNIVRRITQSLESRYLKETRIRFV